MESIEIDSVVYHGDRNALFERPEQQPAKRKLPRARHGEYLVMRSYEREETDNGAQWMQRQNVMSMPNDGHSQTDRSRRHNQARANTVRVNQVRPFSF